MRTRGLGGDGLPLHAGGERRSSAPHQPGVLQLTDHPLRAKVDGETQGLVPALGPVAVEVLGIDHADASQQPQFAAGARVLGLWGAGGPRRLREATLPPDQRPDGVLSRRGHGHVVRVPGGLHQQRRGPLALPEARTAHPRRARGRGARRAERGLERRAQCLGAGRSACDVVADVHDRSGARLGREQRVEAGHAIGFRGRHGQARAHVVQRALADPPDAVLDRVQGREQEVAALPRGTTRSRDPGVDLAARAPVPRALGRSEEGVDRRAFGVGRAGVGQLQIHRALRTLPRARRPRSRACRSGSPRP